MKRLSRMKNIETNSSVCSEYSQTERANSFPISSDRNRIERKYAHLIREELRFNNVVSFVGNKSIPVLRLYRYKEAFAYDFVQEFLKRFDLTPKDYVFDPFCGMGTTLYSSMLKRIPSIGIDKLPVAAFIAQTIPLFLFLKNGELKASFEKLKKEAPFVKPARVATDVAIMKKAFDEKTLLSLRRWKTAIDDLPPPLNDIFLLLFFSILESCSYTSKDGQFLRIKKEKTVLSPEEALGAKTEQAEHDLVVMKQFYGTDFIRGLPIPQVYLSDARDLSKIPFEQPPTAIITSPPYPNRYDYSRSYSLELCFHFCKDFEELKRIRFSLLRSHVESRIEKNEKPPHPSLSEVIEILESAREKRQLNNPRIPIMLTTYFIDMKKCIEQWAKVLNKNAKVALVIDNVRFEGEIIPVDLIFSEMAEEVGFKVKDIITCRYKGNSSQQMKKFGKIPVRETVIVWELQ
jgi:hypothetical protein